MTAEVAQIGRGAGSSRPPVAWISRLAGRGERGMVVLEAALVIPVLVVVALTGLGVARLAVDELAVVAAAREAALQAGRGASKADVAASVLERIPGADVAIGGDAGTVEVRVRRPAAVLPRIGRLGLTHEAVAVAAREPGAGTPVPRLGSP